MAQDSAPPHRLRHGDGGSSSMPPLSRGAQPVGVPQYMGLLWGISTPPPAFRCCHPCRSPVWVANHVPSPPPVLPAGFVPVPGPGGVRAEVGGGLPALPARCGAAAAGQEMGLAARLPRTGTGTGPGSAAGRGGTGGGVGGGARCSRGRGRERAGARGAPRGGLGCVRVAGGAAAACLRLSTGSGRPAWGPVGPCPCPPRGLCPSPPLPGGAQRAGDRGAREWGGGGPTPAAGQRLSASHKSQILPQDKIPALLFREKKGEGTSRPSNRRSLREGVSSEGLE